MSKVETLGWVTLVIMVATLLLMIPGVIVDLKQLSDDSKERDAGLDPVVSIPPQLDPPQPRAERAAEFARLDGGVGGVDDPAEPGTPDRRTRRYRVIPQPSGREAIVVPAPPPAAPLAAPPPFTLSIDMIQGRPSARDIERAYPERQLERGQGARVLLRCRFFPDQSARCWAISPGSGAFSEAAERLSRTFRLSRAHADRLPAEGQTIDVPIVFQVADQR